MTAPQIDISDSQAAWASAHSKARPTLASNSLARAKSLYREGQIDLLALLDVQRSVLASELALADSRLQQALADVQLYKALGGGFDAARTGTAVSSISEKASQ